jgi:hypothetical protein
LLALPVLACTVWLTVYLVGANAPLVRTGANDFLNFYAGGRLAFSPQLYDPEAVQGVQKQFAGTSSELLPFTRLPFSAAVLWPLARLPYATAYLLWQALNAAAVAGMVFCWPPGWTGGRSKLVLALAASLPLGWSFANAQSLPFVMFWYVLALRLLGAGKEGWAGLAFAPCLDKYHLITLLPLALIAMRRYRAFAGLCVGGALILACSFLVQGWDWPSRYVGLFLHSPIRGLDVQGAAPSLHGLAALVGGAIGTGTRLALVALIAATVAMVWVTGRKTPVLGPAAASVGSLLAGPHVYVQDLVLLVPACLYVFLESQREVEKLPAFLLLTPFPYLFELGARYPAGQVIPAVMLVLLAALAAGRGQRAEATTT